MSDPVAPVRRGVDVTALTLGVIGFFIAFSLFDVSNATDLFAPVSSASLTDDLRFRFFDTLGLSTFGFVGAWFLLTGIRFARPSWLHFTRRVLGWTILIGGSTVVLQMSQPPLLAPASGPGGLVGAAGTQLLEQNLPGYLAWAVVGLVITLGLHLAADAIVRAIWRGILAVIRLTFETIDKTLNGTAASFEMLARTLRRIALPIGRRLHPERYPIPIASVAMPLAATLWPATIPIHHHRNSERALAPKDPDKPYEWNETETPPVVERPYDLPSLDLLDEPTAMPVDNQEGRLRDVATLLEKACADFGLTVRVVGIHTGPVITQFEISLDTGMRVSKITSLADDLALHLKVSSVRIVAPIPGKNTVGIEVPNEQRVVVRLKELALSGSAKIAKSKLPLMLGKDSEGRPLIHDLADMPHLLIAGRTGTGKSVCLNSIILSLLMTRRPDECKLIMIDPKQVELAEYGKLPHLMHPVVTDNKKAEAILSWGVDKMEERYEILRRARVRNIGSYNELPFDEILRRVKPIDDEERERVPPRMPYIVIVVDEVGDLMMAMKKEVEGHIIRLAQKSRAAGIHLILTTQRPTVDVITGLIKSNLPARICFQVADRSNSRVVLDEMGAEKLLGKGDMLFLQPNTSTIVRAQGAFASDQEISRVVSQLEVENPTYDSELLHLEERLEPGKGGMMDVIRKRDELYEEAIEVVIREGRGSVSLLQRALGIGYGRAARLVDYMAEDGIVGSFNGGQAREVLFTQEQWEQMKNGDQIREPAA